MKTSELILLSTILLLVAMIMYIVKYQYARTLTSQTIQPHFFPLPSHNCEYDLFNPNGVYDSKGQCIIVMRASDGHFSYSTIGLYTSRASSFDLIRSHDIVIESSKPILQDIYNGFEDMRVFKHNEIVYLIGVNVDRNTVLRPSMVMVSLDHSLHQENLWYLDYPPRRNVPNKNWSPLTLSNGSLGLVVDIHPLLIVTPDLVSGHGPDSHWSGQCREFVQLKHADSPCRHAIPKRLYNSIISIAWVDIPYWFKKCIGQQISITINPAETYMMMTHTKSAEPMILTGLLLYQHYITIFNTQHGIIALSQPFHIESSIRPHIEYISGCMFVDNGLCIMYGLRDCESKYLILWESNVQLLFV